MDNNMAVSWDVCLANLMDDSMALQRVEMLAVLKDSALVV
jgi:hypothetical protein